MKDTKYVGFIIPVINGVIHLARRGTDPCKGLWGAIGGKSEQSSASKWAKQLPVITISGCAKQSLIDRFAEEQKREYPAQAALREFIEEMYSQKAEQFDEKSIRHVYRLGSLEDSPAGFGFNVCYFHLAQIHNIRFCPDEREITGLLPIQLIPESQIIPTTKFALEHIRFLAQVGFMADELEHYKQFNLHKQIPELIIQGYKHTSMAGAVLYFSDRGRLP